MIEDWAAGYAPGKKPPSVHFYPRAIPYLALASRWHPMTHLDNKWYGNPLGYVYGLAIHCTAGTGTSDPYSVARICVETWNHTHASAHFAIACDGTVIQFIPTSYSAFAQGSPGDEHWISVEIDNPGRDAPGVTASQAQVKAAQALFAWVCRGFSVRPEVATGHITGIPTRTEAAYDEITRSVCAAGAIDSRWSKDAADAQSSRGLSCHRWLKPRSHSCPGAGLLSQLAVIADGAAKLVGRYTQDELREYARRTGQ